jgi:hypothetical protein
LIFDYEKSTLIKNKKYSIITRFDCDLSQDCNDKQFKQTTIFLSPETYYNQGLGNLKAKRLKECTIK